MSDRCKRARETAGLSVGQAAKLLNLPRTTLEIIEANGPNDAAVNLIRRMADLYGVSTDWMLGRIALRDYATVAAMNGAEDLSFHDRDIVAEFAASLPTRHHQRKPVR